MSTGYEKMVKKIDRIINEIEDLEFMCNDPEVDEELKELKDKLLKLRRKVMAKHHYKSAPVRPGPTIRDLQKEHPITIYKDCIVIFGD
jgi:Mg2+ and Co2+ transporter CorA